jgi:L-proline amide hydrolase
MVAMTERDVREGRIAFRGYETWYRSVGECANDARLPLLVLHGGPGATSAYLSPLESLADSGRRVIFYDQIGCGRSSGPRDDPAFYDAELFLDELQAVRDALGLERVHLLGQSWGGMLAMQYALAAPTGVASLVVADSPADMRQWVSEANRLRADLPPEIAAALSTHEAAGTTDDPAYAAAVDAFYRRHVCRLAEWPEPFRRSIDAMTDDGFVYNVMNGPSEFHVIGKLKDWTILDRLHEIAIPTLLLSGAYDEATPAIVRAIVERIPKAAWILFPESSHTPHLEEPVAFAAAVTAFLAGIEFALAGSEA